MQRLLIWRNILHVDKSIIGPSPPPLEPILRRFACESMTNSANTRILYRLEQLIVAVVMIVVLSAVSNAQFTESFDGKIASFHRHQSDSSVDLSSWKQSRDVETEGGEVDGETTFERIRFRCGTGTNVFVSHEIPHAYIIPELKPSIRIKSKRPDAQILVRIVLPHTLAPDASGPMTTTLNGEKYSSVGQWQTIGFDGGDFDLAELLKKELWFLRRKYGPHVDPREAYIDRVVVNLYSGPGDHDIQIDNLEINGLVPVKQTAVAKDALTSEADPHVRQVAGITSRDKRPSLVDRDGTVLIIGKRPFFPMMIEHNGEDFAFLKAIGFNTVELETTVSPEQLVEAKRLDMWIVCPPPASIGVSDIGFEYDRVLAWSVGKALTGRDIHTVAQRIREIRESDLRENRPVVGNVSSNWSNLAQQLDILSVGLQPLGTSFIASQYSDWLRQRAHSVATSKPVWADIQTELSKTLLDQVSTISQQTPPTPIEPQQLQFLVAEAITGGARGLRFRSRNRLDAADPASRLRTMTIELANAFIEQIEPWAVGGAMMGEVPNDDPTVEITAFNTNRSRLLLIQRPTHHEQYWAGDVPLKDISISDTASAFTDRAYQLTDTRLKLLSSVRNMGGTEIQIPDCPFLTAVVFTQDPLVVSQLSQSYQRIGKQSIQQMRSELSQQWIAIMQLIDQQMARMGRGSADIGGTLNEAVTAYRVANDLIVKSSGDAATTFLDRTEERLGFSRRETAVGPLGLFQSKTSTPFVAHASLIPLHWQLTDKLKTSGEWDPNGLPAGDFESLEHMQRSGWENHRIDATTLTTRVELSSDQVVLGRKSLKLTVTPNSSAGIVEETPLWIVSPAVKVQPKQMVQIHGWVNVPQMLRGNMDGLMITDSFGGQSLAERIVSTDGWEEFTLYRSVNKAGELNVRFDLTGYGEAYLDEVTIRTIDLK